MICAFGLIEFLDWWEVRGSHESVPDASRNLRAAACWGNVGIATMFLVKGATIDSFDKRGRSPLLWAAYRGYIEIVKLLLGKGAGINMSVDGRTPLFWAVIRRNDSTTNFLVEKGADFQT